MESLLFVDLDRKYVVKLGSATCEILFYRPEISSVWNCWIVVDLVDLIRLYFGKSYKLGYHPNIHIHVCTVD